MKMGFFWWLVTGNAGMLALPDPFIIGENGRKDKQPHRTPATRQSQGSSPPVDASDPLAMSRYAEQTIADRYKVG